MMKGPFRDGDPTRGHMGQCEDAFGRIGINKEDRESQLTVGLEELMQWGTSAAGYGGHRTRVGSANPGQASRLSATTATGYAT
ncbi:hypothetical protein Tco_0129169 [Tanacetum coccineum]